MTYSAEGGNYDPPKTESTWMQGVKAFRAGLGIQANPYSHPGHYSDAYLDWAGWENGWTFARSQWAKEGSGGIGKDGGA